MKALKGTVIALLAVTLALGFIACDKENPISDKYSLYEAPEYQVAYPDNSPVDFGEATLDNDFIMPGLDQDYRAYAEFFGGGRDGRGGRGGHDWRGRGRQKFMPFARILYQLQLTEEQREQVKDFIFDHRLCVREVIQKLRETEREILSQFKERRMAIIQAYKSGEITREEAVSQLRELNAQVRETLKNNPARVQACEAMKDCMKTLFENIRSILTPEQQAIWDEWVSKLPERDCGGLDN